MDCRYHQNKKNIENTVSKSKWMFKMPEIKKGTPHYCTMWPKSRRDNNAVQQDAQRGNMIQKPHKKRTSLTDSIIGLYLQNTFSMPWKPGRWLSNGERPSISMSKWKWRFWKLCREQLHSEMSVGRSEKYKNQVYVAFLDIAGAFPSIHVGQILGIIDGFGMGNNVKIFWKICLLIVRAYIAVKTRQQAQ